MVYLITGKAGSGKTTYARKIVEELSLEGIKTVLVDADVVRGKVGNHDFSDGGRERNLMQLAEMAKGLESDGFIVFVAAIAPKKTWRQAMRLQWKESRLVYLPGGSLWPGTTYEMPDREEF